MSIALQIANAIHALACGDVAPFQRSQATRLFGEFSEDVKHDHDANEDECSSEHNSRRAVVGTSKISCDNQLYQRSQPLARSQLKALSLVWVVGKVRCIGTPWDGTCRLATGSTSSSRRTPAGVWRNVAHDSRLRRYPFPYSPLLNAHASCHGCGCQLRLCHNGVCGGGRLQEARKRDCR